MRPGERGTAAEQRANLHETCQALRPLLTGGDIVVTHGNGPQVGNELVRQERAADEVPALPLYLAVAQTQAEIGALIESELAAVAERPVVCVLTHVRVDEDDPAFAQPTKPVGPFYSKDEARALESERGWALASDAGRGWRRVVPSPEPREIVEQPAIEALLDTGAVVVAAGGGGIPVVRRPDGSLAGVEAVVDKDLASALLAGRLGAEVLLVLTGVEHVAVDFGRPGQRDLQELGAAELAAHAAAGQFAPGSMLPKVQAVLRFLERGGRRAVITTPELSEKALAGEIGTQVTS